MQNLAAHIKSWNRKRLKRHRAKSKERSKDDRKFLAVIGMVKNEAYNIDEWIEHYIWQGADQIFVIDNGSTDSTLEKLSAWSKTGKVTVIEIKNRYQQRKNYQRVYREQELRKNFKWLLIADADEFWYSPNEARIVEAINTLDYFDLIYCNWKVFGTDFQSTHPKSLRRDLVMRQPGLGQHEFSKWVAKTDALGSGDHIGIHRVGGMDSAKTITEYERLHINHYVTQSLDFWKNVKMKRGDSFDPANDAARDMKMFERLNLNCTFEDRELANRLDTQNN